MLLKTTADLDSTWLKTYGGSASDVGYDIQRTSDFGFIVAGRRTITETGIVNAWALRTNTTGDTLWTRTMTDDIHNWFQSVDLTSDGGYAFAGLYTGGSLAAREIYAVKLAGDGAVESETFYGTSTEDVGMSIAQIFSGDYIIGGYTGLSGSGSPGCPGGKDRSDERGDSPGACGRPRWLRGRCACDCRLSQPEWRGCRCGARTRCRGQG